jgi:hypothetical protein
MKRRRLREAVEQIHESIKTLRRESDYSHHQIQRILAQIEQDVAILYQQLVERKSIQLDHETTR